MQGLPKPSRFRLIVYVLAIVALVYGVAIGSTGEVLQLAVTMLSSVAIHFLDAWLETRRFSQTQSYHHALIKLIDLALLAWTIMLSLGLMIPVPETVVPQRR